MSHTLTKVSKVMSLSLSIYYLEKSFFLWKSKSFIKYSDVSTVLVLFLTILCHPNGVINGY